MVEPSPPDINGSWPHFLTGVLSGNTHLTGIPLLLKVIARTSVRVFFDIFNIAHLSLLSPYSNM
jgi:hypothetical protein